MIAGMSASAAQARARRCPRCGGPFMTAHGCDGTALKPKGYAWHCSCCGVVVTA